MKALGRGRPSVSKRVVASGEEQERFRRRHRRRREQDTLARPKGGEWTKKEKRVLHCDMFSHGVFEPRLTENCTVHRLCLCLGVCNESQREEERGRCTDRAQCERRAGAPQGSQGYKGCISLLAHVQTQIHTMRRGSSRSTQSPEARDPARALRTSLQTSV